MPTAMPKTPLKRITPGQIKALHAIGRRRGLSHADLRDAAGVASLKDLSVVEASKFIDQLQLDDHRQDWRPGDPDRASARNIIRLATERQRNYIASLFDELGWDSDKAAGWLQRRHGIRDLAAGVFSSAAATEIIVQLEQALKKHRATAVKRSGIDLGLD